MKTKMINLYKEWKRVWDMVNNPWGSVREPTCRASFGLLEIALSIIGGIIGLIILGLLFFREKTKGHLKRVKTVTIEAWSLPLLSEEANRRYESLPSRVLRVLGGISIIITTTGKLAVLGTGTLHMVGLILCTCMMIIYLIHTIYFIYQSIKQVRQLWKEGKLYSRNSPISTGYTTYKVGQMCFKGMCKWVIIPTGIVLGVSSNIDEVLVTKGYEPRLIPFFGDLFLPATPEERLAKYKKVLINDARLAHRGSLVQDGDIEEFEKLRSEGVLSEETSSMLIEDAKETKQKFEQKRSNAEQSLLTATRKDFHKVFEDERNKQS